MPIPVEVDAEVAEEAVSLRATDGVALDGRWFEPARAAAPVTTVLIACGAGIPARFYHRLAQYLAGAGAAVLTFDYRGIGGSRSGSLRGMTGGMEHWATCDLAAALAALSQRHPALPATAIAHSVGALLLGAAPGAERLARAVFVAPHTGFWGDYRGRWRLPLGVMWHVLMPAITRVVGYFPGRSLRLGDDLPPQVALDWARRRQKALVVTAEDARRFGPAMARYAAFRASTLALSMTDDAFAPPPAGRTLLAMYPGIDVRHETVSPATIGVRRLGHLGFLRRDARGALWPRIAAWLQGSDAATR